MPSSKIPLPVKKTYSDACLYSVPKQSPLERMRNDFEHKRAEEKQRIRAISLAQIDHRKHRLLNNGDGGLVNNNFVGCADFFNEPVVQFKGSAVTDLDPGKKSHPVTESAYPSDQLFRPEKRSAGRDRSHPLASLNSHLTDNRRVTDGKQRNGESSHIKKEKFLNNTYTVKKPPAGNQSQPYLMQPNPAQELRMRAELPPVRLKRLPSADSNYSAARLKQKSHDSDENADLQYSCMENEEFITEKKNSSTNCQPSSAKKVNNCRSRSCGRQQERNEQYAERQTLASVMQKERTAISPVVHSVSSAYSPGNTPVSCVTACAKDSCNDTADSPACADFLYPVPVPPAGNRTSDDGGSNSANQRRRQLMKQTILKQQRLKMMNGGITDTADWREVSAGINNDFIALEEDGVHHTQQDSEIQQSRQHKLQHPQDLSIIAKPDSEPCADTSDSLSGSVNNSQVTIRRGSTLPSRQAWRPTVDPCNESTAFYLQALEMPAAKSDDVQFVLCDMCNRSFAADRIQKHQQICTKEPRRRKVFDPVKMRVQGTDFASYVNSDHKQQAPAPKKSNWRQQHENFVQNLQYARKVSEIEKQGGKLTDLPPPPVTVNPDYVKCPTCGRNFNESAAERHIQWCKEAHQRAALARSKPRKY